MVEREERLVRLAAKARALPKVPGVYLMKDDRERVIYVGKARVLPNRVRTYFQASADLGPKNMTMLAQVNDFDTLECETEWEALLAENRLIKDLRPRYNIRLTDDKSFPYLAITTREDFPGVYITRAPGDPQFRGAKIFGPFISGYALRESIKLLQRVFKFRTCELDIQEADAKRRHFRPCLLHPIGQCTAPCGMKISKQAYRDDINRFIRFLESKRSVMLRQMRQEMAEASKNLAFEQAATLRDQIKAIEKLEERGKHRDGWQPEIELMSFYVDPQKALASLQRALKLPEAPRLIECFDIAHLQGQQTVGSKVAFVDGRPMKSAYRRYRVRTATNDDYGSMREVVSRAYREAGQGEGLYPDVILIDGGPGQLSAAHDALADYPHQPPTILALAKKEELIYQRGRDEPIRLGRDNLGLKLCQALRDEAHRFAQGYHHLLRKKKVLEE
ncbi:MAG: excinuclease ABC subunit UvrC [Phycisphaeraceae bacterium]